jgi:hypothetical protein
MSSNEYWGGVNRRFDRRAALLRRFGFRYSSAYVKVDGDNGGEYLAAALAVFSRPRRWPRSRSRLDTVSAEFVSLAGNREWRARLADLLVTGFRVPVTA